MQRDTSGRVSLIAAILVALGALLTSFFTANAALSGLPLMPRALLLPDPIGWGVRPGMPALPLLAMLLALAVLVGGTWLFVRLVARGSIPGRFAPVFFGTWGAITVAAWIAGVVRAPVVLSWMQLPPDLWLSEFSRLSMGGASWGLLWGWITALVVALVHRMSAHPMPTAAYQAPVGYPAPTGYPAPAHHPTPAQPTYPAHPGTGAFQAPPPPQQP